MESRYLNMDELNKTALEHFVYQPVSREMIRYLAEAAGNVIACDPSLMPQASSNMPTPPKSPEMRSVLPEDDTLPTLEEFITRLVVSSNVQVPTLMSTLVYLNRLKAKLQPMARGLRCTTHRIFLACLILAAKYLNDSSPKNKHWANYSHINTASYSFGFNRTEVNLMEKQLLFLLEWDLRISQQDLYRELDSFLEPLRVKVAERHARKMRHREVKKRPAHAPYPSPPTSRGTSRSPNASPEHARSSSGGSISPPGLSYSSSGSSYAPSIASSRRGSRSRSTTPSSEPMVGSYYPAASQSSFYDSPVQLVIEEEAALPKAVLASHHSSMMLPYDISKEQHQHLVQETEAKKRQTKKGMWGRLLSGAVAVR